MSDRETLKPRSAAPVLTSGVLQRKCACGQHTGGGECEECKKKGAGENSSGDPLLQRSATGQGAMKGVPPSVHEVLASPGEALDAEAREYFEPRFETDFSGVRVHTDEQASASAKEVNALAYTAGKHMVFHTGQYHCKTPQGRQLLAHELSHVVQQSLRSFSPDQECGPADRAEQQANENAKRFREFGRWPSPIALPANELARQANTGGSNQSSSTTAMSRTQFDETMKRQFKVTTVRTGTFTDQQFGDMQQAQWASWDPGTSSTTYSLIVDAIQSTVTSIGGMPPVQDLVFFKVDFQEAPNSSGQVPVHVIPNASVGASFSGGRLQIFEAVSQGNRMLDLQGQIARPGAEKSIRRNITHELGHSVAEEAMNQANRPGVDPSIMTDYKAAVGWLRAVPTGPEKLYDISQAAVQNAVKKGSAPPASFEITGRNWDDPTWKERPVTWYSTDNPGDDFAEAFMAYVNEPAVLKKYSPRRYEFIDSRKARWGSRLVKGGQAQPSGTPAGQKQRPDLPLRKDFNKEIERSVEDL